jgi:hypothetical protein
VASAGFTARIASIRWDRNHTTLLSSWSTVNHATATPSALRSFAHWAASVLFPKPVGPWITVSFLSCSARRTSSSLARSTSAFVDTGSWNRVAGVAGVSIRAGYEVDGVPSDRVGL